MKTVNGQFSNILTTTTLCLRKLKSLSLLGLLYLWEPQLYTHLKTILRVHVPQVIQRFRAAFRELVTNKRHFIAVGFMVVGCGASVLYHLFDKTAIDKGWYFLNWYYFLYTIREELMLGFWAVGTFLFLPSKYKLAFVPSTMLLAYSIAEILHYYFFVTSMETFHMNVPIGVIVPSLSLALGIIISTDYLTYRYHHLSRGNHSRIVGVLEMNIPFGQKEKMLNELVKEYRNHNGRI